MARTGRSSPLARLGAVLGDPRTREQLGRAITRQLALLAGRAKPSALALGRELTIRTSPPPPFLFGLLAGAWATQSVSVVARLGIADLLKSGPMTCEELAAATGSHGPSLYRVMRALASLGLFDEDAHGRFSSTRLGLCLESDAPGSMHAMAVMMGEAWHWQVQGGLLHTVRTGEPAFGHDMGQGPYEYFAAHPDVGARFSRHIEEYSRFAASAAALYALAGARTIVDVGGGYGAVCAAILSANPSLRAVLFDRPDVVKGARAHVESAGLADRCELVAGDFFKTVPAGGDVYVLASILHNWDDRRAGLILERCRDAMRPGSKLLLIELVVPPGNMPAEGKFIDLEMLVVFPGGRERTVGEYQVLLEASGFRLTRVIPTPYWMSLIEAVRS